MGKVQLPYFMLAAAQGILLVVFKSSQTMKHLNDNDKK
jgi:hypothetical protein